MATSVPTISSHVLDTSRGLPVAGLSIAVSRIDRAGAETALGTVTTDHDGRAPDLLGRPLEAGTYRLRFGTSEHSPFLRAMSVDIQVGDINRSYHVPLLLSPFGLSTYLGS